MSGHQESARRWSITGPTLAFVALTLSTLGLLTFSWLLQGSDLSILLTPSAWLRGLDQDMTVDTLANAADVVAAVLSIAITVVAIVVELAANRYSHRITWLFVREPINIGVMSLFVVTTLLCVWVAFTPGAPSSGALLPNAGFALTMTLVTLSLLVLLPYFAYVFGFLSPLSIIEKLRKSTVKYIKSSRGRSARAAQARAEKSIDELQDVARRATELSDSSVAMASIEALDQLIIEYQGLRGDLPEEWFRLHDSVAGDADFVALAEPVIEDIQKHRSWFEIKVMRQYLSLVNQSVPRSREIAYLVAIHTKRIATIAKGCNISLLDLCIRCFNSYLRTTINARDPRTCYYVLNQYRQLAEEMIYDGDARVVRQIAEHFQFYGLLGFKTGQPFLLEVAAYDLSQLIIKSLKEMSSMIDPLIDILLGLDQEVKSEPQEASLIGVRRAQIQIATLFAECGDDERTERICEDLKLECADRLWQIQRELMTEDRIQYWEFTDRGVNFSYLHKARRAFLPKVLYWLEQNKRPVA